MFEEKIFLNPMSAGLTGFFFLDRMKDTHESEVSYTKPQILLAVETSFRLRLKQNGCLCKEY